MEVYSDNLSCKCDIINLAINSIGFFMPQLDINVFLTKRIRIHYSDSVTIITVKDFKFWQSNGDIHVLRSCLRVKNIFCCNFLLNYLMLRSSCAAYFQRVCKCFVKIKLKVLYWISSWQPVLGRGQGEGRRGESFVQNAINHQLKLDIPLHLHI